MFPTGSIIKRPIAGFWGLFYYHTGIYIGDSMVIHLNGEISKDTTAIIKKDSLEVFASGFIRRVKLHAKPTNEEHSRKIVAKAAEIYKDAENSYNNKYSVVLNNCEDFTTECFEIDY